LNDVFFIIFSVVFFSRGPWRWRRAADRAVAPRRPRS
jgi:hypothetical protein